MPEELTQRFLGDPAQTERSEGNPKLARREHSGQITRGLQSDRRQTISTSHHGFEPSAAGSYEGKLHGDKEAVEGEQPDDDQNFVEHVLKLAPRDKPSTSDRPSLAHVHAHRSGTDPASHLQIQRRLVLALVLTSVFLVVEVVGGIIANSLALLADAAHMLTDAAALGLALFAGWFSRQPATPAKTYGYLRWEVLAAFINGAALLVVSAGIVWEALARIARPEPVGDQTMLLVGVVGLLINVICALLLHGGQSQNMNLRGAYLHVLGDLLGSVATIVAAVLISTTGWDVLDPVASLLVTLLIVRSAWRLVRESVDVLLEATPAHIDIADVRAAIGGIRGVDDVHDLHVWTLASGVLAMSAHATVPDADHHADVLSETQQRMAGIGINHVTLQIEQCDPCVDSHA